MGEAIMVGVRMAVVGIPLVLLTACATSPGITGPEHHGRPLAGMTRQAVCVECHNFETARHHPSGIPYPPAGKEEHFPPPRQLAAKGITVQNGEVTCQTCHELENRERWHLPVGMTQSTLCLACHQI